MTETRQTDGQTDTQTVSQTAAHCGGVKGTPEATPHVMHTTVAEPHDRRSNRNDPQTHKLR